MRNPIFSSLRARLLILVLLATLPAIGLLLYNAYRSGEQALETARGDARQLTRDIASGYERTLFSTEQTLRDLAEALQVLNLDPGACKHLLTDILAGHPYFINLGAARPDGHVFCSAAPMKGNVNVADRLYFRNAMATQGFAVGEYQMGRIVGKPVLITAYPVFKHNTRTISAVVYVSLDLAHIHLTNTMASLGPGFTASLFDGQGKILARYPDVEKWTGQSRAGTPLFTAAQSQPEGLIKTTGSMGSNGLSPT